MEFTSLPTKYTRKMTNHDVEGQQEVQPVVSRSRTVSAVSLVLVAVGGALMVASTHGGMASSASSAEASVRPASLERTLTSKGAFTAGSPTKSPSSGLHKPTWKPSSKPVERSSYKTTMLLEEVAAPKAAAAGGKAPAAGGKGVAPAGDVPSGASFTSGAKAAPAAAGGAKAAPAVMSATIFDTDASVPSVVDAAVPAVRSLQAPVTPAAPAAGKPVAQQASGPVAPDADVSDADVADAAPPAGGKAPAAGGAQAAPAAGAGAKAAPVAALYSVMKGGAPTKSPSSGLHKPTWKPSSKPAERRSLGSAAMKSAKASTKAAESTPVKKEAAPVDPPKVALVKDDKPAYSKIVARDQEEEVVSKKETKKSAKKEEKTEKSAKSSSAHSHRELAGSPTKSPSSGLHKPTWKPSSKPAEHRKLAASASSNAHPGDVTTSQGGKGVFSAEGPSKSPSTGIHKPTWKPTAGKPSGKPVEPWKEGVESAHSEKQTSAHQDGEEDKGHRVLQTPKQAAPQVSGPVTPVDGPDGPVFPDVVDATTTGAQQPPAAKAAPAAAGAGGAKAAPAAGAGAKAAPVAALYSVMKGGAPT